MDRTSDLCFSILIFLALLTRESFGFKWLFIGNVTDEEYSRHNLCYTEICLKDADILIKAATLNASVDPCVDFKSFALGEFHYYRHLNDRYQTIGFQNDVHRNLYEKKRVALEQKQQENEPKVFRVMKHFFGLCRNSDYIRGTAASELISILRRYVSLSQASNGSWLKNGYYTKVLFEFEPMLVFENFLHHSLRLCDDPRDYSKKLICFQGVVSALHEERLPSLLKRLDLKDKTKQELQRNYGIYLSKIKKILDGFGNAKDNEIYKIKELPSRVPFDGINWLKVINDHLFKDSRVTEDDEILIASPLRMKALLLLLRGSESQIVADVFSAIFIYDHQRVFDIYKLAPWNAAVYGTIRSWQRFEECISFIQSDMKPALTSLLATKYYKKDLQKAAEKFSEEVVADSIVGITFHPILSDGLKQKIIEKLSTIKLWVAFPPNILNHTIIDEFYDELALDGNESFVETWMQLAKFGRRLSLERKPKSLGDFADQDVEYDFERNILDIPLIYTVYPRFHPNRSRFFNLVTLYMPIINALNNEVTRFVNKETNETIDLALSNRALAYGNYDKWLLNGGKELQLPGFKLTNRQMYWLGEANVYGVKFHKSSEAHQSARSVLQNKYYHVSYKCLPKFRKDFHCDDMTEAEKELFKEFKEKEREIYEKVPE